MPDGINKAIMSNEMLKEFEKKEDYLVDIFKEKKKYLKILKHDMTDLPDVKDKEHWTKEHILMISNEMNELLDWINWKFWKKPEYPINEVELKFELADILHFVINLFIIWDMEPKDVYDYFMSKHEENINRQLRGY